MRHKLPAGAEKSLGVDAGMVAEVAVLSRKQQVQIGGVDASKIDRQPPQPVAYRIGSQNLAIARGDDLRRRSEQIDRRSRINKALESNHRRHAADEGQRHRGCRHYQCETSNGHLSLSG